MSKILRIVIYSPSFYPNLGGLETVVKLVATDLVNLGHEVAIITDAINPNADAFNFEILRKPNWKCILKKIKNANIYMLANISLWGMLPLIFIKKPWIAMHQGWYQETGQPISFLNRIKKYLASKATQNISASQSIKTCIGNRGVVIHNPYENSVFRSMKESSRENDVVFLGRLVSDKGVKHLLNATYLLKKQNFHFNLTIIGSGPEESLLKEECSNLGLSSEVTFAGPHTGQDLALKLNSHKIMVIPSLWDEPFGVVALEGAACGCFIVGSSGGGLSEAIGPCGITFPNGDVDKLAEALKAAIIFCRTETISNSLIQHHLKKHYSITIAREYLGVMQKTV